MQQSCHRTFCRIVDQRPDLFEMIAAAGVGVGDGYPPLNARPGQVQRQPFTLGRRRQAPCITQVGLVGTQDPVETVEIHGLQLACAQAADVHAVPGRAGDRAAVRRLAHVPVAGASRINLHPPGQRRGIQACAQRAFGPPPVAFPQVIEIAVSRDDVSLPPVRQVTARDTGEEIAADVPTEWSSPH